MAEPDDGPAAQRSEDPHLALPGQSGARGGRAAMSRGLVKNRSAAAIQISAEQLLREARDRQIDTHAAAPPRQHVADAEELADFCRSKRKEFEDKIRMQRQHIGTYIQYAAWEESQHEFERARSVFERALDMEYQVRRRLPCRAVPAAAPAAPLTAAPPPEQHDVDEVRRVRDAQQVRQPRPQHLGPGRAAAPAARLVLVRAPRCCCCYYYYYFADSRSPSSSFFSGTSTRTWRRSSESRLWRGRCSSGG